MVKKVDHVGLSVTNLEKSIAFYGDLLGLEVERILEPAPERDLGKVNGIPGSKARIAHLRKGEAMLELFQYLEPKGTPLPKNHKQADIGFIHAGFASSDVRGDYKRLKEKGVEFLGEPVEFRPTVWVTYFKGPDGEIGELREV
jgi:catechol 2,3-dioxygenase-like lactoylglutathione lyase family enzyme